MTLFDIDKNAEDRGAPSPNSSDQIIDGANKAHATTSINPTTDASAAGYISTKTQAVIANDGTTNKALLGYQQGLGKWGLFVANDGVDVATNTDLSKFNFNSSQDAFKIVSSGTISVIAQTLAGNGTFGFVNAIVGSVNHNLGYQPIVLGFTLENLTGLASGAYTSLPLTLSNTPTLSAGSNLVIHTLSLQADSTTVYAISQLATYGASTATITVPATTLKYYLLQETAA